MRLGVLAGKLCRIAWDWVALNQVTRYAHQDVSQFKTVTHSSAGVSNGQVDTSRHQDVSLKIVTLKAVQEFNAQVTRYRAQELCESRGGRPGLPSLISLRFLWDVKQHFNRHVTPSGCQFKIVTHSSAGVQWPGDTSRHQDVSFKIVTHSNAGVQCPGDTFTELRCCVKVEVAVLDSRP